MEGHDLWDRTQLQRPPQNHQSAMAELLRTDWIPPPASREAVAVKGTGLGPRFSTRNDFPPSRRPQQNPSWEVWLVWWRRRVVR